MSDDLDIVSEREKKTLGGMTIGIVLLFLLTLGFYAHHFFQITDNKLSPVASDWGVFGDFIGGLFNPIVSMVMLLILFRSYLIQRTELRKTVEALSGAAEDQEKQTKMAAYQGQMDVFATQIETKRIQISAINTELNRVAEPFPLDRGVTFNRMRFSTTGEEVNGDEQVRREIDNLNRSKAKLMSQIEDLETGMQNLADNMRALIPNPPAPRRND